MANYYDVEVVHHAVDSLPGGASAMLAVSEGRVDAIFSRLASVDEIVAALGPLVSELTTCCGVVVQAVA